MTTLPEEAVKAAMAAYDKYYGDLAIYPSEEPTPEGAFHAALKAALPFLPVQVAVKTGAVDTTGLVKALSRLAGNRHSDGVSSLVTVDDRSAIIDGCYALMVSLKSELSANACPCTKIQQDETCPVGYPSLLCEICDGKGVLQPSAARELALVDALEVAKMELQAWIKCADENGLCVTSTPHVIEHIDIALASHPVADKPDEAGAQGDGWMPIESAPKDGECVLVWKPDEPRVGEYICVAYWDDAIIKRTPQWVDVAGRALGFLSKVDGKPQGYPTHWRPLPSEPASEGAE